MSGGEGEIMPPTEATDDRAELSRIGVTPLTPSEVEGEWWLRLAKIVHRQTIDHDVERLFVVIVAKRRRAMRPRMVIVDNRRGRINVLHVHQPDFLLWMTVLRRAFDLILTLDGEADRGDS